MSEIMPEFIKIDKIQFIWFWGKPIFHWWAYPPDFKSRPVFQGKPIMWRLGLGFLEIRLFPKREAGGLTNV